MFNFIKKKTEKETVKIVNPIEGVITDLKNVPDPVYAQKMMGDGFAVIPESGVVVAPCDGEITVQPDSLHACGIRHESGLEIMVHFGTDTVKLQGVGFSTTRKVGDKVNKGDEIFRVDLEEVRKKVTSTTTPVVITNMDDFKIIEVNQSAKQGQLCLLCERVK